MLIQALLYEQNQVQIEPGVHKLQLANYYTGGTHDLIRRVEFMNAPKTWPFSVTDHSLVVHEVSE